MKRITFVVILSFIWLASMTQPLQRDSKTGLQYIVKENVDAVNLVILIHGYGSNEKDLFSFADKFPRATVVCVRGWITRSATSYSWYDIEFRSEGNRQSNLLQANESSAKLVTFVESMKTIYVHNKTIIGGFSQGAIMSAKIGLENPKLIDGVLCISGMLLSEDLQPIRSLSTEYKKVKAFCGHGLSDQLLPIQLGRDCAATLRESGIEVEYHEYPIKHQISSQELKDIGLWYNKNFILEDE